MSEAKSGSLLVISERGIGDALTLIPALTELRRVSPQVKIDMIAPGIGPLEANLYGLVRLIDPDDTPLETPASLRSWLNARGYVWVWNTLNSDQMWRECLRSADNPRWISAPPHGSWPKQPVILLRMKQLQVLFPELRRVSPAAIRLTQEQLDEKDRFAAQFPLSGTLIAIQPGGNDPNKVWSKEGFIEVILRLSIDTSRIVVLFLHKGEWTDTIPEVLDRPNIVTVRKSLSTAMAMLAACNVFIGNDSGFYHLAHALGLGVVGIYRTTGSRKIWSYESDRSRGLSFYLPPALRKHWRRFITADRVVKAALSVISNQ